MFSGDSDQDDVIQGMEQRNEAEENFVEEVYLVPYKIAGSIFGIGGERIKSLQIETGCSIKVAPRSNRDPNRCCTLIGSRKSVKAAKSKIEEIIRQSVQCVKEILIPGPYVGRLIGHGGENLKDLQLKCGVKMAIIQDGPEPTIYAKPLRISGDQEKVKYGVQMVADFLAQWGVKVKAVKKKPVLQSSVSIQMKKVPHGVLASRSVIRTDLQLKQGQDDSISSWLVVLGLVIFSLIICSSWVIVGLVFLSFVIYLMNKKD